MVSIDGFPIKVSIDMSPDTFDPPINEWSYGKVTEIEVADTLYRPVKRTVTWKDQSTHVWDFELFQMIIRDWMDREGWSKEQALDEFFDMV